MALPILLLAFIFNVLAVTSAPVNAAYTICGLAPNAHVNSARGGCTYPYNGFRWMQVGPGTIYKISNTCRTPEESSLRADFATQLSGNGSGAFATTWPSGWHIERYPNLNACQTSTTVDNLVDIKLDWQAYATWYGAGRGNYGGVTSSVLGSAAWCATFGDPWPCGFHISTIQLNQYRFNNVYTAAYGTQVLMHEVGHAMGFNDYCGGGMSPYNSISENDSDCGGAFGHYQPIDRSRIVDTIYKNR